MTTTTVCGMRDEGDHHPCGQPYTGHGITLTVDATSGLTLDSPSRVPLCDLHYAHALVRFNPEVAPPAQMSQGFALCSCAERLEGDGATATEDAWRAYAAHWRADHG